jgi:NTE family protein
LKNSSLQKQKRGPSLTLALGGGGSRGAAHIGVLRVLEREGFTIAGIAGSSIGGLIAAVYAAGISPDEIEQKLAGLQDSRMLKHPPRVPNALMGLDGVATVLRTELGDKTFDDLEIPLALTALDVVTGQEVVLRSGSVVDAVLATIAIPGVFPSFKLDEYELVDGGMSNPTPVAVARSLSPKLPVVAVSLAGVAAQVNGNGNGNGNGADVNVVPINRDLESIPIPGPFRRLRLGQSFMAYTRAINASGRIQGEMRLAMEKPDLVLRPDVSHVGVLEAADVHDLAARGEEITRAALPQLRRIMRQRNPFGAMANLFTR